MMTYEGKLPPLSKYAAEILSVEHRPEDHKCYDCDKERPDVLRVWYVHPDGKKSHRPVCRDCLDMSDPKVVLAMLRGSK
jgi:hypothetical protein